MQEDNQMLQSRPREAQLSTERSVHRYGYSYEAATANKELDLNQYLKVLLKYKRSIITFVVLVTAITALGLARTRPTYEASTTIQIDPEKAEILGDRTMVFQNWLDPEYYNTQLRLLGSPSLARQVVKDLDLEHNPDFLTSGPTTLTGALLELVKPGSHQANVAPKKTELQVLPAVKDEPFDPKEAELLEPLVGQILGSLQVNAVPKTRLVQIIYRHQNPQLAEKVANAVANAYILSNLNRRIGSSKSTSSFLQKRVADLQAEIRRAEEELINYGKMNKIISLEPSQNTVVERLAMLNRQLLEVEGARKEAEAVYKLSRDGLLDSIPEVQSSGAVQGLQTRISALKQKRAELIVQFTEDWPEVKQVDQTIKQLEDEQQNTKKNIIAAIETRYRTAQERERLLRADLNAQMGATLNQNESAISYKIKQQDLETKKELYKTLLSRYKEVDLTASSETNNISVVDFATIPKWPVSPRVNSTLFFAFFGSLLGSIGLAFLREYMDNRIKSVEDIDRFINLPTLGLIPTVNSKVTRQALKNPTAPELSTSAERRALLENIELVAHTASNSSIAESYRQLRTSVLLSSSDRPNKIILITSSQPTEGKTTTALNTAISLAQTGARTVLVDCDLRNTRLQRILDASKDNGLSTYLSGHCHLEDLVHEPVVSNLYMILSGPIPPNPAELLGSNRMKRLLNHLVSTYDYVIVDSPPILSFADSIILSTMVDGVLLVISSDRSGRDTVQRARRSLEEANARILGVVLNRVTQEHSRYGNYYYNYYGDQQSGSKNNLQRAIDALKLAIKSRNGHQNKEQESVGGDLKVEIKKAVDQESKTAGETTKEAGSSPQAEFTIMVSTDEGQSQLVFKATENKKNEYGQKADSEKHSDKTEVGD
jgi:polysaccharide biosynthesis transport protein